MPQIGNGHFAIGSVSTGTLRVQDLLRAFADAYEAINPFNGRRMACEAREMAQAIDRQEAADEPFPAYDTASEMVEDLSFEINYVLSQGRYSNVYFGTLEGDGADFGFWEVEE